MILTTINMKGSFLLEFKLNYHDYHGHFYKSQSFYVTQKVLQEYYSLFKSIK